MVVQKENVSIRMKIIITIATVTAVFVAVFFYLSNRYVFQNYQELERGIVISDVAEINGFIGHLIDNLHSRLTDWANWDDTYNFVGNKNDEYIKSNLTDSSTISLGVNSMIFLNRSGDIVYSKLFDLNNRNNLSTTSLNEYITKNIKTFLLTEPGQLFHGIIKIKEGNIFLVAEPILTSEKQGPAVGTLIFGKLIDPSFTQYLSDLSKKKIDVYNYISPDLPSDLLLAKKNLSKNNNVYVSVLSDNLIAGYFLLFDIKNNPVNIIKLTIPRDIFVEGTNTANIFLIFLLIATFIFGLVIYMFIEFTLIRRMYKINDEIFSISNTVDVFRRLKVGIHDEIGQIETSINTMLDRLFSAQSKERESIEKEKIATEQLKEQMTELQDSKSAIINLLEDIENEKKMIEDTVKIRTKELSDEKSRLGASLNSLSFGLIIMSMDGRIILSNPILLKILDITKDPSNAEELSGLFKSYNFAKTYKECIDTQETIEIKEIVYYNKFLKIFLAPVVNINKIIDYVVIIEDITEAKVADISKDEFFAVASHELRTPLTAIRGNADMILDIYKDKLPDNDVKEMLTDIDLASVRLINLVNNFLEVSRLEQGKFETKMEEFDISDTIDKVLRDLTKAAEDKKLKLEYSKPGIELPKVFADKNHVEEILVNIIGNAIKYTNNGKVTIYTEPEDKNMIIKVVDTGVGINEKNQNLLFRKFQQANDKVLIRSDSNSTGLGLYISKLLLQSMGGEIRLEESEPNFGSTFVFTLQLAI